MNSTKTAVVIPSYKVAGTIADVIRSLPSSVDHIIVVDDGCPEGSGRTAEALGMRSVTVLRHERNRGVGSAVVTGYRKALELGCDIVVKMDGDGQMDPRRLSDLVRPLQTDAADYTKGNRFRDFRALRSMPKVRLLGNSGLSFLVKLVSGYWNSMDPTNGYTAVHRRVLEKLNLDRLAERFFFEIDMLVNLNIVGAVVADVEMPARYGPEQSSLSTGAALLLFPGRLLSGLVKRLFLRYFVYDFNMASVYLLLGLPLFLFSLVFGIREWIDSYVTGVTRSAGTIMLAALPLIVSFQMLLQAVNIDIQGVPRKGR